MPEGLPGRGDVETSIWPIHYPFLVVCTSSRRPRSGTATYRGLRRNGTTFYQSEIPLLHPPKFPSFFPKWKAPQKVGPFSQLQFPNGISCSMYVSRILYQFHVHGRAPRRTGVYDQVEKLFTNGKFHFCSRRNFRVFFLNGKRPILASCSQGESWLYSGRAFR